MGCYYFFFSNTVKKDARKNDSNIKSSEIEKRKIPLQYINIAFFILQSVSCIKNK